MNAIEQLYEVILQRQRQPQEGSYTCYLFEKGLDKILKKVGEECSETLIASKNGKKEDIVYESADLIYHLLVMLAAQEIPVSDVLAELEARSAKIGNLKQMRETDKNS